MPRPSGSRIKKEVGRGEEGKWKRRRATTGGCFEGLLIDFRGDALGLQVQS